MNHFELLSPAGSFECMVAAFNAGADAVYLGGTLFGARAFAQNFSEQSLIESIEYAHLRNKKIYLTINTLLKNRELENSLVPYLEPLYKAGLDAVIVQDFGVLSVVHNVFPDLEIHASTQMTVTGAEFAKELKRLGVTRIVPARELSFMEISKIKQETDLEIETFVHGALCYSYSGQCLLSSLIGGRSGNRGRCAQPCRLPYNVSLMSGKIRRTNVYPLSPKDLCTLDILPEILDSGVYSLKIEGRMKKPEYVASVTSIYRKYLDMYINEGNDKYRIDENDIRILKEIYNRGGFTDGYYKRHNGKDLISLNRPNHMGVEVGTVSSVNSKNHIISFKLSDDINNDDIIQIFTKDGDYTLCKISGKKGQTISLPFAEIRDEQNKSLPSSVITKNITLNSGLMRTRNSDLINRINSRYVSPETTSDKLPVKGLVIIKRGKNISFSLTVKEVSVTVYGDVPMEAMNRPIHHEDVYRQLSKLGDTPFYFKNQDDLSIELEDNLFLPVKVLNLLRREAVSKLTEKSDSSSVFTADNNSSKTIRGNIMYELPKLRPVKHKNAEYLHTVLVSTKEQLKAVLSCNIFDRIYIESDIGSWDIYKEAAKKAGQSGSKIYMALPYIFREHGKRLFSRNASMLNELPLDGYLFRNMEEYFWFINNKVDLKEYGFDNTIYALNNYSVDFLNRYKPDFLTCSFELNSKELSHIQSDRLELVVYGNIPVMISAGCLHKTIYNCNKSEYNLNKALLTDRLGNNFVDVNHCNYCYNVLYNNKPVFLLDLLQEIHDIYPESIRLSFTTESGEEVLKIINELKECSKHTDNIKEYTRGHFKRGID